MVSNTIRLSLGSMLFALFCSCQNNKEIKKKLKQLIPANIIDMMLAKPYLISVARTVIY